MFATKKSNAERIAECELQYHGRNTYWDEPYERKEKATLKVRGVVFTYHPKEEWK